MDIPCPSCGAPIPFRTSYSVFAVCAYCGATVVRRDQSVERIGTMADLPDEMTPFQVGTTVQHDGAAFTLAGRLRVGWADGAWNEWFMLPASGGEAAWLAEAQGTLAVSVPRPPAAASGLPAQAPPSLDAVVTLDGVAYRVADIKAARCIGSEGELPFPAPQGRQSTYADMLGPGGGFASAEYGPEGVALYAGRYVTFRSLSARNLRPIEGWAAPAA